jgi:hypothetical protein
MLELPDGGYVIDTPGIKGFGTFDMEPEEITSYFKEIFHFSKDCLFYLRFCERYPFASAKGYLLACKRIAFGRSKDSF